MIFCYTHTYDPCPDIFTKSSYISRYKCVQTPTVRYYTDREIKLGMSIGSLLSNLPKQHEQLAGRLLVSDRMEDLRRTGPNESTNDMHMGSKRLKCQTQGLHGLYSVDPGYDQSPTIYQLTQTIADCPDICRISAHGKDERRDCFIPKNAAHSPAGKKQHPISL